MKSSRMRPRVAGFSLFAVLLAVAFMAGLVATFGRHVVVAGRSGMASPALLTSREACHSGLALARQSIVSGQGVAAASVPVGEEVATVSVSQDPAGNQVVSVESVGQDGLGARRKAEIGLQPCADSAPTGPSSLPTLSSATIAALLSNGALAVHHVTHNQRLESSELTGLYVVDGGCELQLADVVLHGAVISASALAQAAYGAFDSAAAPRLLVDGNVRIDPLDALPGLAILMPDGTVHTGATGKRIQIHGDVVAYDVSLLDAGVLEGHVAAVQTALASPTVLDRMGIDRKPPAWSSALDFDGKSELVFFATVPPPASAGSMSSITDYWKQD